MRETKRVGSRKGGCLASKAAFGVEGLTTTQACTNQKRRGAKKGGGKKQVFTGDANLRHD